MLPIAIYPYKEDPVIRKMRVQAWFQAVTKASKLTSRELERKFQEDDGRKVNRSYIWDKYRRGEVVPRSGTRPDGGLNLVDRVEAEYSGTAHWLTLPLWRLLDKAPMEMSEVRCSLEGLPNLMRQIFIYGRAKPSGAFWRRDTDYDDACEHLLRFRSLDGLTAVLALVKEAEIVQDQDKHRYCACKVGEYLASLQHRGLIPEMLIGECLKYLSRRVEAAGYFSEVRHEDEMEVELCADFQNKS